ncbi:MAG: NAD(P)H-hydrate epimerase [Chloroflexi bacterium]|nr:NAD(P)H-hydrate epimerase [Chloroflexota bacterium]
MAEVDRLAVDEFGIALGQMMELAGAHLAEVVRLELGGHVRGRRVVVAVGPGNNGGGGLVAARHLANRGASVRVILARPASRLCDAGRHQLGTLLDMAIDCCVAIHDVPDDEVERELATADVVIDALLGYGSSGPPRDGVGWLIDRLARRGAAVISLDLPSGIDPDTGEAAGTAVTASATLTLALPKQGLVRDRGRDRAGRIYLGDIGLPAALFRRIGLDVGAVFEDGALLRLEAAE